ncbi:MAG TPA: hypothetical protein VI818_02745 [Candidatus Thermoplasmatota archaeon]|nr:hypothetical protein [Candidatus Thermoplasmatota archaeon]
MANLDNWVRSQVKLQSRIFTLEDALLSNRFWAYAWYRLRYFFPRFGAESALHLVRVSLLYTIFSANEFVGLLLLHTVIGLAKSFWWGALEVMRERVRSLSRDGNGEQVPREIGRWLGSALQVSLIVYLGGAAWTVLAVEMRGEFGVLDLYVLSIILGLSVELVTRAYHSGIFATRRIYRPLGAILAVELVSFAAVLGLWPLIGSWSFPLAGIVSTLLASGLTFHYTNRMYVFFRFQPFEAARLGRVQNPFRGSGLEGLAAGFSNAFMSLDSLLILALFAARPLLFESTPLFMFFFAVAPTIGAGADWARLFYFDLKRLDAKPFRNLRARFEQAVFKLSWLMGLTCWAAACLIATLVYQRNFGELYLLMIPFFLSRSVLAASQIKEFTERTYNEILATGGLMMAAIAGLSLAPYHINVKLVLLSAIVAATAALLRHRETQARWVRHREVAWPIEWLGKAASLQAPTRVCVIRSGRIPDTGKGANWRESVRVEKRMADRVAAKLGRRGAATLVFPNRIAWYEPAEGEAKRVTDAWLAAELGGSAALVGDTGPQRDGLAALEVACTTGFFGPDFQDAWKTNPPSDYAAHLASMFRTLIPGGIVYDLNHPSPAVLASLPPRERRRLIHEAIAFARDFRRPRRRGAFEVTALSLGGGLRQIFLVDARASKVARYRWRKLAKQFNLRAAIDSAAV